MRRLNVLLIILALILLLTAAAYHNLDALQHTMAHWTGEAELNQQLRGTLALAYLKVTQPPPRTALFTPMPHTGLSPYGMNTFLEQEVEAYKVEQSLRLIHDAGFRWIRQQFPWEDIEISAKGDFWDHRWNVSAWEKYDRLVDIAEAHGIEIIARLDNPPAWSRAVGDAEGWSMAPPDDYADFGDFVYAVVSRYKGRIRYYQIWNEPNIYPEWGDQPADPEGYVELLRISYERAKEADPDCVIIAAGLAQTTEETPPEFGPRNMSDLLYLERMYEAGVQGAFDIMGAQVYGLWTGPYDRRIGRDRTNFARVELLREIMVRHGDADKPIWATEVGWNALPEDVPAPPLYGRVSEETQAVYAIQAYQRAANEWPWMGVMSYWFFRRPSDAERDQAWYYFRLLEPDFQPLPAFDALTWLAQQPPTVSIGYHQEDHWALHYEGGWQHIQDEGAALGAYALGADGDTLRFYMEGTDLALVLRDPEQIYAVRVRINDQLVQPRGRWGASVPSSEDSAIVIAGGLEDRRHTVELEVIGEAFAMDGIIVWRAERGWDMALSFAFVAALGTGLVLAYREGRR
jgi:polysaccharide biosynthesis protein PslG